MNKEEKLLKLKTERENISTAMNDPCLCDGTASVYSRVSGYYRATSMYNIGKVQEFKERRPYKI